MLILVLGGARSGKSAVAEQLAVRLPQPVTYVATLITDDDDVDMADRISKHRARRPVTWRSADAESDLAAQLREIPGTLLLDSLGPWVASQVRHDTGVAALCDALRRRPGDSVVVSDEVGLAVHPTTEAGLAFRDNLGDANAAVAAIADQTLFVVAGRVVTTAAFDPETVLAGGG